MGYRLSIQPMAPGLDPQYTYGSNYAAANGLTWGRDFISSCGPYGYVMLTMDVGGLLERTIIFNLVLVGATGLAILCIPPVDRSLGCTSANCSGNRSRLRRQPSRFRISVVRTLSPCAPHRDPSSWADEPCCLFVCGNPRGILCSREAFPRSECRDDTLGRLLPRATAGRGSNQVGGSRAWGCGNALDRLGNLSGRSHRARSLLDDGVGGGGWLFSGNELRPGALVDWYGKPPPMVRARHYLGRGATRPRQPPDSRDIGSSALQRLEAFNRPRRCPRHDFS